MSEEQVYKVEIVGQKSPQKEDHPLQKFWRPAVAIVYLLICIFDFVIAPSWIGITSADLAETVAVVKDLNPEVQKAVLEKNHTWSPLTLAGGGLFHLAFGAILGASAATRGLEKTARAKKENGGS